MTETGTKTEDFLPDRERFVETDYSHNPKNKDIDGGWAWVVLFASVMIMAHMGAFMGSIGIFHIFLIEAFQEDDAKTAWVGSLSLGLAHILAPIGGWVCNKFSCRTSLFLGGVLGSGALAVSSQVGSLDMAFLTMGFLTGMGFCLVSPPSMAIIGYYFDRRQAVASGICVIGIPVGIMAAPAFLTFIESHYGWRGAVLIFAGVQLNFCVFATLCKPSCWEKRKGQTENAMNEKRKGSAGALLSVFHRSPCRASSLVQNKAFLFWILALFLSNVGMGTIYLHMPRFCTSQGATIDEVKVIYVAMGVANMTSKLLTGLGTGPVQRGERLDKSLLLLGGYSLAGMFLLILPFVSHSQAGRLLCLLFVSFYYNIEPPHYLVLTFDLVGLKNLNNAIGVAMTGVGSGYALGPPFAAWVREMTQDYKYSFFSAGVFYLFTAISILMMMMMKGVKERESSTQSVKQMPLEIISTEPLTEASSCA